MNPALKVSGLQFAYGTEVVLGGISLEAGAGESVGLAGANGSGKSTLLWCVAGLLRASGEVRLFGEPLAPKQLAKIGMVFQNPEDQLFMPNLIQDLALPLLNSGIDRATAHEKALVCLREFGLEKFGERPAAHLSLGQRKRAAVALALFRQPQLLLMYEPTAELDGRAVRQLSETLQALTVAKLIASHDLRFLRAVTTRTVLLGPGRILADGPTGELLADEGLLQQAGLI
jgi:cobalt/nickel transport system ATP-binding protein